MNSEVARQLLGLDVVETLLRHVDGSPRAIRAYQGFEQVPMTSFLASTTDSFEPGVVNVNRLLAGLSNGYTFNLIGLDRRCPLLGELAEHLERLIGGRVEISALISRRYSLDAPPRRPSRAARDSRRRPQVLGGSRPDDQLPAAHRR